MFKLVIVNKGINIDVNIEDTIVITKKGSIYRDEFKLKDIVTESSLSIIQISERYKENLQFLEQEVSMSKKELERVWTDLDNLHTEMSKKEMPYKERITGMKKQIKELYKLRESILNQIGKEK